MYSVKGLPLASLAVAIAALSLLHAAQGRPAPLASRDGPNCPTALRITAVYGIHLWPRSDWQALLDQQLTALALSGIAHCAAVHVVLSAAAAPAGNLTDSTRSLLSEGRNHVWNLLGTRIPRHRLAIHASHGNATLFHSLHRAWLLARAVNPADAAQHLVLHLHNYAAGRDPVNAPVNAARAPLSEGATGATSTSMPPPLALRDVCEEYLFSGTVEPWRQIVDVFSQNATVTHTGMFPLVQGSIWQNFWWARAAYLQTVPEPVKGQAASYYDSVLGHNAVVLQSNQTVFTWRGCSTCFSLEWPDGGPGVTHTLEDIQALGCPPSTGGPGSGRLGAPAPEGEEW